MVRIEKIYASKVESLRALMFNKTRELRLAEESLAIAKRMVPNFAYIREHEYDTDAVSNTTKNFYSLYCYHKSRVAYLRAQLYELRIQYFKVQAAKDAHLDASYNRYGVLEPHTYNSDNYSEEVAQSEEHDEPYYCKACHSWRLDMMPCEHMLAVPIQQVNKRRYMAVQNYRSTYNNRARRVLTPAERSPILAKRLALYIYALRTMRFVISHRFAIFSQACWPVNMMWERPQNLINKWLRNAENERNSYTYLRGFNHHVYEEIPLVTTAPHPQRYLDKDLCERTIAPQIDDCEAAIELDERKHIARASFNRWLSNKAVPEMEREDVKGNVLQTDQASNVILTSANAVSSDITTEIQPSWSEYCSSDVNPSYATVTDRWLQIETFKWQTSDMPNTFFTSYALPKDIIVKEQLGSACRMPNLMAFNVHRYWRGDIEVKVQVNANRFQIGSLQVSWLYAPHFDQAAVMRKNIFTLSQTNHAIITANTSNEAVLYIPYKYYLPLLHTKPRADMPDPLNMGQLYITVINPLTVPVGGPTYANVSVFVRLVNSEFTGMLAGDIDPLPHITAQPEMERACNAVLSGLNTFMADPNRDNPPGVSAPRYLVPTAAHSWSVGTNLVEPLHTLRLDAKGQTPHPPGALPTDDMTISNVTRIFGLVKTIEWSKNLTSGSILDSFDAAPILHRSHYTSYPGKGAKSLTGYALPPVAVASSMFMGWRGSLEFRFDVVASQYHTGRVMIGYIPGASSASTVNMAHLRASTNVVYTLNDSAQFSFTVPYIANKPVWPRRYGGDYRPTDNLSPSRVYIAIVNQLIPMQNVSEKVYLNMYMRAGPDFELLVPVQPSLGLLFNRDYRITANRPSKIQALSKYYPYYSGTFEDLDNAQCFRWGTLSHQIAKFTAGNWKDIAANQVSYCVSTDGKDHLPKYTNSDGQMVVITTAVFFYLDSLGYVIGVPCRTEKAAQQLAINVFGKGLHVNDPANKDFVLSNTWSTTGNTYTEDSSFNCTWTVKFIKIPTTVSSPPTDEDSGFVLMNNPRLSAYPEGERENVDNLLGLAAVRSTSNGKLLYGESFSSFKDLARRYQLYGVKVINNIDKSDGESIKFSFPCLPQGLSLDTGTDSNINELFNRGRDGHIPLIASGYRFYRGGLRYRLVLESDPDMCIFIQHRPDRILEDNRILDQGTAITGETVANHTYASYIQLTSVNGVVEFEVPYYMMGLYGLLQSPKITNTDESNFFSIGEISVGMILNNLNKNPKNLLLSIFYSAADDLNFSTFQGFPPMAFCSDVPQSTKVVAQPEGLMDYVFSPVDTMTSRFSANIRKEIASTSEGLASAIKDKVADLDMNYRDSVIKMALSLSHTFVDTSPQTLVISIITILLEMKILIFDNVTRLISCLTDAIIKWVSRVSSERISETTRIPIAQPEMMISSFNPGEWVKVLSLIFAGICAAVGITCAPPSNMRSFATIFTKHIPDACRAGNFLLTFMNATLDICKRFLFWIIRKTYPIESFYYSMEEDLPDVKAWTSEVLFLEKQNLTNVVDFDGYWIDRVLTSVNFGHRLITRCVDAGDKNVHLLYKIQDRIEKIYDKLSAMGKHPFTRREPFCIWVCGTPGIGKSFLMEFLSTELLKAIKYKTRGPKVFTIMPATEFWTGCRDQPVLNMDDAFSVEMGETLERQLNTMYMVKSPVALNPPMASLEDKHLRYNPEIFYINSNKSYLNISGLDPTAIHRRRDVLIEAIYNAKETKDLQFSHLRFNLLSPCRPAVKPLHTNLTYEELCAIIIPKYIEFYDQEMQNYLDRVATYDDLMTTAGDDIAEVVSLRDQMYTDRRELEIKYLTDKRECLYTTTSHFLRHNYDLARDYCAQSIGKLWPVNTMAVPEGDDDVFVPLPETMVDPPPSGSTTGIPSEQYKLMTTALPLIPDELKPEKFTRSRNPIKRDYSAFPKEERVSVFLRYEYGLTASQCFMLQPDFVGMLNALPRNEYPILTNELTRKYITAESEVWYDYYEEVLTEEDKMLFKVFTDPESYNIYHNVMRDHTKWYAAGEFYNLIAKKSPQSASYSQTDKLPIDLEQEKLQQTIEAHSAAVKSLEETLTTTIKKIMNEPHPIYITHKDLISKLLKYYGDNKLSKADADYLDVVDEPGININITDICPIPAKYTSLPRFHFYNKPWKMWEPLAAILRGAYVQCTHVKQNLTWDYDKKQWFDVVKKEVVMEDCLYCVEGDDDRPSFEQRCIMHVPLFSKLYHDFHILSTSRGRTYYKENKIAFLPLFYHGPLDDIKQLADNWFKSFAARLGDFIKNSVVPKLWHCVKFFAYVGVVFGSAGLIGWVYSWLSNKLFTKAVVPEVTPIKITEQDIKDGNLIGKGIPKLMPLSVAEKAYTNELKLSAPKVTHVNQVAIGESADANYNNIIRKILHNSFVITTETINADGVIVTNRGRGLGLRGHQGIFIRHYHEKFMSLDKTRTKFYLERMVGGSLGPRLEIDYSTLIGIPFVVKDTKYQTNFFILQFPLQIPPFKDMTNNIAPTYRHDHAGVRGDLVSFGSGVVNNLNLSLQYDLQIAGEGSIEPIRNYSVYAYQHHGAGVCGSVLLARNLPSHPIIGMHVAGVNGLGFSEPLYLEMFKDVPVPPIYQYEELDLDTPDLAKVKIRTTVQPLGVASPQMTHAETGKTSYVKSSIHGCVPVDTEPNPLSPSDPRIRGHSPMQLGCEKHGMPVAPFEEKEVHIAGENLQNMIIANIPSPLGGASVWTLQDAICGNPNVPHCEPLDWGTSPGVGYEEVRKGEAGKRFLFKLMHTPIGLKCMGLHPKLLEIMTHKDTLRKQNIVPMTIFTDCLKDTCLPKEKCLIPGKTRIFSISPVDFTIQFKQYFGAFMAGYTASRFNVESAIGINVDGPEWSDLALRMAKHGPHIVDGDYSNFGPGLSLQLVRAAFDIILYWYQLNGASAESQRMRRVMIAEFIAAPHLCFNLLYRTYSGIPSGSPITSILNSMVNCLLIRLAWLNSIKSTLKPYTMLDYNRHVVTVTYGDDVFMNVSAEAIEHFNLVSIIEYFKTKNITFTNSLKTRDVVSHTTLDKISFLSRGFTKHPFRGMQYLAPLKKTSIHSCVNWIHRKGDPITNTIQNADMALVLAYGHGEEYYRQLTDTLLKALSMLNVTWVPKTWSEMDTMIWDTPQEFKTYEFPIFDFR